MKRMAQCSYMPPTPDISAGSADRVLQTLKPYLRHLAAAVHRQGGPPSESMIDRHGDDLSEDFQFLDVYIVPILLRRIEEHVLMLKRSSDLWTGALATYGQEFLDTCEAQELGSIRNVLEHLPEYIVGEGRDPSLVDDADEFGWQAWVDGDRWVVVLFGRSYDLSPAILAAEVLREGLNHVDND